VIAAIGGHSSPLATPACLISAAIASRLLRLRTLMSSTVTPTARSRAIAAQSHNAMAVRACDFFIDVFKDFVADKRKTQIQRFTARLSGKGFN
jgi:hypothetical protein